MAAEAWQHPERPTKAEQAEWAAALVPVEVLLCPVTDQAAVAVAAGAVAALGPICKQPDSCCSRKCHKQSGPYGHA